MSKYIDTEKLKTELKKLSESDNPIEYSSMEKSAYNCALYDVELLITSLQQEQSEVDLEKEYKTWWNSISGKINIEHVMEWYMHETARHFYELGLNARKEE